MLVLVRDDEEVSEYRYFSILILFTCLCGEYCQELEQVSRNKELQILVNIQNVDCNLLPSLLNGKQQTSYCNVLNPLDTSSWELHTLFFV